MSEPVLSATGIWKTYPSAGRRLEVLRGLGLCLGGGESVAVVGESGVGKSTLLHILGGLDHADRGELLFRGADMLRADRRVRSEYRNRSIGFVFQFHHLLPEFTALENVEMPFRIGRRDAEAVSRAREILVQLGLGDRLHHRPAALSGGEQQRVAIARAVAPGPSVVLADEPTGNLDPATARAVFDVLRELETERGFALVVATHSGRLARSCDRMLRLEDGLLHPLDEAEAERYFEGRAPSEPGA